MSRTAPKNVHLRRGGRSCAKCGCTDDRACPGGCTWVEDNLCSRCLKDFEAQALPLFDTGPADDDGAADQAFDAARERAVFGRGGFRG